MRATGEGLRSDAAPRWVRRATWGGVLSVILAVSIGALLIGLGAADPPTAGPVTWSDDDLRWADGPLAMLEPGVAVWWPAPQPVPQAPESFTLAVRARLAAQSDALAAWGVWIMDRDGARVLYALSAGGYWTIRVCPRGGLPGAVEDCPAPQPDWGWSPFPRITPAGDSDTITLHCEAGGALRLRINDEALGAPVVAVSGTWGVWARGGMARAAITWERAWLARAARK